VTSDEKMQGIEGKCKVVFRAFRFMVNISNVPNIKIWI
jgi:hypothetical protein